jgi:hypothetical protein
MKLHPSDLSTCFLQNGQILVWRVNHFSLASSTNTDCFHLVTSEHSHGRCTGNIHPKQNLVPQSHATSFRVELSDDIHLLQSAPGQNFMLLLFSKNRYAKYLWYRLSLSLSFSNNFYMNDFKTGS